MTIAVIMTIWAAVLIWKDRTDWVKYAIVLVAAAFLAGTPTGQDVISGVGSGGGTVDKTLGELYAKLSGKNV